MNSAASRHVPMPPIAEIGLPIMSGWRAISDTMLSAMGLTAGPQYPPCVPLPSTVGIGAMLSRSMAVIELIVLISDTASAPPRNAASAGLRMSVMLGVSFTMHGMRVCFFTHDATISMYSGTWPTAEPMPRSDMPCGQPKFSSTASAPVSSTGFRISRQDASSHGTISETIIARSGQSRFTWRISARLTASGRSVISSMLLRPATRCPFHEIAP